jgi:hypothetical protein
MGQGSSIGPQSGQMALSVTVGDRIVPLEAGERLVEPVTKECRRFRLAEGLRSPGNSDVFRGASFQAASSWTMKMDSIWISIGYANIYGESSSCDIAGKFETEVFRFATISERRSDHRCGRP